MSILLVEYQETFTGSMGADVFTYTVTSQSSLTVASVDPERTALERGHTRFELSNHLGNVLAVISDRKLSIDNNTDGSTDYYKADVASAQDYYPFGMQMHGRIYANAAFVGGGYRFGFNGQEKDNELFGEGNSTTATFWQYDARLGRRWDADPIPVPYESPFAVLRNRPLIMTDRSGAYPGPIHQNSKTRVGRFFQKAAAWLSPRHTKWGHVQEFHIGKANVNFRWRGLVNYFRKGPDYYKIPTKRRIVSRTLTYWTRSNVDKKLINVYSDDNYDFIKKQGYDRIDGLHSYDFTVARNSVSQIVHLYGSFQFKGSTGFSILGAAWSILLDNLPSNSVSKVWGGARANTVWASPNFFGPIVVHAIKLMEYYTKINGPLSIIGVTQDYLGGNEFEYRVASFISRFIGNQLGTPYTNKIWKIRVTVRQTGKTSNLPVHVVLRLKASVNIRAEDLGALKRLYHYIMYGKIND